MDKNHKSGGWGLAEPTRDIQVYNRLGIGWAIWLLFAKHLNISIYIYVHIIYNFPLILFSENIAATFASESENTTLKFTAQNKVKSGKVIVRDGKVQWDARA